jgi:hypothetical protein
MTDLKQAAQQFVTDYENGDLGDLKHYARALRAALEQEQEPVGDSYADLFNALQRIETAAVFLPSFKITHEGGLEAVVQNIVDAIAALAQPRQFTFAPKPPSPPPAPQGYDGTEAGLHDFSWRNHV